MKDIKVRAWNSHKKQYYYFFNGRYFDTEDLSHCISERICSEFYWNSAEQYTGMKAKSVHDICEGKEGKEIYEGDIVKFGKFEDDDFEVIARIFWDDESHAWGAATGKEDFHVTMGCRGAIWCYMKEIVGNIYENPEMLI